MPHHFMSMKWAQVTIRGIGGIAHIPRAKEKIFFLENDVWGMKKMGVGNAPGAPIVRMSTSSST
jgi:hypothetical protein